MSNQQEEEAFIRSCAEEVMVASSDGDRLSAGAASSSTSTAADPAAPPSVSLSLPNFLEFLVRYAVRRMKKRVPAAVLRDRMHPLSH